MIGYANLIKQFSTYVQTGTRFQLHVFGGPMASKMVYPSMIGRRSFSRSSGSVWEEYSLAWEMVPDIDYVYEDEEDTTTAMGRDKIGIPYCRWNQEKYPPPLNGLLFMQFKPQVIGWMNESGFPCDEFSIESLTIWRDYLMERGQTEGADGSELLAHCIVCQKLWRYLVSQRN